MHLDAVACFPRPTSQSYYEQSEDAIGESSRTPALCQGWMRGRRIWLQQYLVNDVENAVDGKDVRFNYVGIVDHERILVGVREMYGLAAHCVVGLTVSNIDRWKNVKDEVVGKDSGKVFIVHLKGGEHFRTQV
jgi:hypothetical protein